MLLALAIAWLVLGVLGVAVMRRRGHNSFGWALLFMFFGPLAVPLAVSSDRNRPPEPQLPSHDGAFDVLVALDGSADHTAASLAAVRLLGEEVTSVTVAEVMDLDAPTTVCGRDTRREAEARLETFARDLESATDAPVDTVILYGPPHDALQRFAADHGYELIVAGNGSKRAASVPVLNL